MSLDRRGIVPCRVCVVRQRFLKLEAKDGAIEWTSERYFAQDTVDGWWWRGCFRRHPATSFINQNRCKDVMPANSKTREDLE